MNVRTVGRSVAHQAPDPLAQPNLIAETRGEPRSLPFPRLLGDRAI
jgi:hypothetical protein